jgi:PAS domain S-box-containing protein
MVAFDANTLAIVAVSNAMVRNYGYSREEFETMTILDLALPEDVAMLQNFFANQPGGTRPGSDGRTRGYPRRRRRKDGSVLDVEVTSENVELDGRMCRIALYTDVTERNRVAAELANAHDRAVEASNTKSAFLANMSHELRTPMNGVIGMNDLLLESGLSEDQRELALQVSRSGEQMLAIINDILDIAKLEAGRLELDLTSFDLREVLDDACAGARTQARASGLTFELAVANEVPPSVYADRRRLQQVVMNLVTNAVKFTTSGGVTVRVVTTAVDSNSAGVRIEVTDTGIGIDPERLRQMFEPFSQADVSTTRLYGGTGLGLAIVRELVELMGGTVEAESEPGRGSTFTFELELMADASAGTPSRQDRTTDIGALPSWESPPLVLVAEDSPVNQIVATRALERCGCRVEVVGDGAEAGAACERQSFDAVLMDCQMPGMDGYAATTELRRRENGSKRTPIIAMTAHAMAGDRERCIAAGMDDYLSKPMRRSELAEALARWIPADGPTAASGS